MINVYYRLSDGGYAKEKPHYVNNKNCLSNFLSRFQNENINIIADNISDETWDWINNLPTLPLLTVERTSLGSGAQSFNHALKQALDLSDDSVVYFVEDDYLHKENSSKVLLEGIKLGADYVTLYDHPDKYINGINPHVTDGGEETKVFLTDSCHWKFTNSTTMTFATTVKTLSSTP